MPLPDDRLERILFVTLRFGELRGLVCACSGAFLIVGVAVWSLLPTDTRNVFQNVAFFAAIGTMLATSGQRATTTDGTARRPSCRLLREMTCL